MSVDMSPRAVTTRLRRVSQLRRLCLSLGRAGARAARAAAHEAAPATGAEPGPAVAGPAGEPQRRE
jgi:hypothetical protein